MGSNQDVRQARGMVSGELTLVESARLNAQQNHIERVETCYRRNDGHLGAKSHTNGLRVHSFH